MLIGPRAEFNVTWVMFKIYGRLARAAGQAGGAELVTAAMGVTIKLLALRPAPSRQIQQDILDAQ